MPVCLQGGAEFGSRCREMDARLLELADGGRVVVTALAGAPGREYDTAGRNGVRHFRELGADDVVSAPDARSDEDAAYQACAGADLLVLPGGSPARLLQALTTTRVGAAVGEVLGRGGVVMGASAGAMVLCAWTVLPEHGPRLAQGLGTVPNALVLPHHAPGSGGRWLGSLDGQLPADVVVLGLPEQSGLLLDRDTVTALGDRPTSLLGAASGELAVGASTTLPGVALG